MLWYHLVRRSSYCLGQWSSGLTGSLLGARCEQVGQRLSCDVLWDTDADKGEEFRGGGSIFIQRQKQDRFGYGINSRMSASVAEPDELASAAWVREGSW